MGSDFKSHENLSESDLLKHLWDGLSDGLALIDQKGNILKTNNSFCEIVGFNSEEILNKPFSDFIHDKSDFKISSLRRFCTKRKENLPKACDLKIKKKDGTIIFIKSRFIFFSENPQTQSIYNQAQPIQDQAQPIQDQTQPIQDQAQPVEECSDNDSLLLMEIKDITDDIKMNSDLQKYFQIVEESPASVVITDKEGNIEYVNKKFCQITQYSFEEAFGQNPRILNAGKQSPSFHKKMWDTLLSGNTWHGIFLNKKKNGELYWENAAIAPLIDSNGSTSHFIAIKEDITQRIKAEEALKREKELFTSGPVFSIEFIPTEKWPKISIVSANVSEIIGYTPSEMTTDNFDISQHIHPDDKERVRDESLYYIENKIDSYEVIYRFKKKDGRYIWLHNFSNVCRDKDGKPTAFRGYMFDTSESIIAYEQLRESEERFRQVANNIDQVFWLRNEDKSKMLYISPAYEKIWGRPCDELYSDPSAFSRYIIEEDQPAVQEEYRLYLNTGTFDIEYRIARPDGEIRWIRAKSFPVKDDNNRVIKHAGIATDITDYKKLEKSLENRIVHEKILMEIAVGFINSPMEQVDSKVQEALETMGKFVSADRSYIFYYDWEKYVCNNIHEWCNQGISPQIENLQNVQLDNIKQWVELHINGSTFYEPNVSEIESEELKNILQIQGIKSIITVPMMKDSKCIGFVGFDSVKNTHTYSESERNFLLVFSKVLVNVISRKEILNNLIIANEKAEQSNKLKSAFINNISHEIRTPLNGLLGFGDYMLDESNSPEEKNEYYKLIKESSNRLLSTVNDLILMSQLQSRSVVANVENIELISIMHYISDILVTKCHQKDISVVKEFGTNPKQLFIQSDRNLLINLLNHITSNACKFTDNGTITIGVKEDSDFAEIYIKDTGRGIPKDKMNIIFESYVQGEYENNRTYEGKGLGLSIVKNTVELLNGKIEVESEEGKGTKFTISIPKSFY